MTTTIRLQREAFDIAAETATMTRGRTDIGAVVTFTGICRADENGAPIAALTLEHYPGMAEAEIARHVEEAYARWPLLGVSVDPSLRAYRAGRGHRAGGDGVEPSRGGVFGGFVPHGLPENARAVLEAGRGAHRHGVGRSQDRRRRCGGALGTIPGTARSREVVQTPGDLLKRLRSDVGRMRRVRYLFGKEIPDAVEPNKKRRHSVG